MITYRINIATRTGEILRYGALVETCAIEEIPFVKARWERVVTAERRADGQLGPYRETRRERMRRERIEAVGR